MSEQHQEHTAAASRVLVRLRQAARDSEDRSTAELQAERAERLTVLRGQLTLLRMRAERGIPISVESVARVERLARTLELFEVAA
jgi:hypothetical protein